jgi:hypothetical protein
VSVQPHVWRRLGMLIFIACLGSACAVDVQPVPYTTGKTEVDLETRDATGPARYAPPRHVSQYRYDGTEVDLAAPLPR